MSANTVDVKVKAHVEVGEMRKMEEAIQREIVQLRTLGAGLDKITAKEAELASMRKKLAGVSRADKFKAGAQEIASSIPGVSGFMTAFNGGAVGVAAIGMGISKAFSLAADSIRAFAASQVEMAKLDAALANSGKLTDAYREKLSALATERSGKTGIDDEKYVGVFTTLTKFGADSGNIVGYTRAVENLAGFMGGDLEQAAFLFGKAMQGSTEMLGRYGIEVDKSKSASEQLADIMRQLEARGGGQLEAMGNTMQGAFNKAGNAWENLLESMGSAAEKSGLAETLANWASGVQAIADKLGGGAPSQSKNRSELVGSTPEEQKRADALAVERSQLEEKLATAKGVKAEAEDKLATMNVGFFGAKAMREKRKPIEAQKDWAQEQIFRAEADLRNVDWREKNFKRVNPEEAAAERTRQALRVGSVELSPGGNAEDIATAQKNASVEFSPGGNLEDIATAKAFAAAEAERNASTLKGLSDQADLGEAGGDPARLAQVKWQQDYEKALASAQGAGAGDDAFNMAIRGANASMGSGSAAAPGARPTDRLLEIGGFTGGGAAMSTADRSMSAIEKYTSQMASEIKKMVENTKPRLKEENTF